MSVRCRQREKPKETSFSTSRTIFFTRWTISGVVNHSTKTGICVLVVIEILQYEHNNDFYVHDPVVCFGCHKYIRVTRVNVIFRFAIVLEFRRTKLVTTNSESLQMSRSFFNIRPTTKTFFFLSLITPTSNSEPIRKSVQIRRQTTS